MIITGTIIGVLLGVFLSFLPSIAIILFSLAIIGPLIFLPASNYYFLHKSDILNYKNSSIKWIIAIIILSISGIYALHYFPLNDDNFVNFYVLQSVGYFLVPLILLNFAKNPNSISNTQNDYKQVEKIEHTDSSLTANFIKNRKKILIATLISGVLWVLSIFCTVICKYVNIYAFSTFWLLLCNLFVLLIYKNDFTDKLAKCLVKILIVFNTLKIAEYIYILYFVISVLFISDSALKLQDNYETKVIFDDFSMSWVIGVFFISSLIFFGYALVMNWSIWKYKNLFKEKIWKNAIKVSIFLSFSLFFLMGAILYKVSTFEEMKDLPFWKTVFVLILWCSPLFFIIKKMIFDKQRWLALVYVLSFFFIFFFIMSAYFQNFFDELGREKNKPKAEKVIEGDNINNSENIDNQSQKRNIEHNVQNVINLLKINKIDK